MRHFEGSGLFLWGGLTSVRLTTFSYTVLTIVHCKLLYRARPSLCKCEKECVAAANLSQRVAHTSFSLGYIHAPPLYSLCIHIGVPYTIYIRTTRFDTLACRLMFNTTANDRNETRTLHTERDPRLYTEPNTINSGKSLENQIYIHF